MCFTWDISCVFLSLYAPLPRLLFLLSLSLSFSHTRYLAFICPIWPIPLFQTQLYLYKIRAAVNVLLFWALNVLSLVWWGWRTERSFGYKGNGFLNSIKNEKPEKVVQNENIKHAFRFSTLSEALLQHHTLCPHIVVVVVNTRKTETKYKFKHRHHPNKTETPIRINEA